jgi:hypothetical protein
LSRHVDGIMVVVAILLVVALGLTLYLLAR